MGADEDRGQRRTSEKLGFHSEARGSLPRRLSRERTGSDFHLQRTTLPAGGSAGWPEAGRCHLCDPRGSEGGRGAVARLGVDLFNMNWIC